MTLRPFLSLILLLSLPAAAARPSDPALLAGALQALQQEDLRVAAIAYRLATRNVSQCRLLQPQSGITVHSLSQYAGRYRDAARSVFGLSDLPAVLVVVPGSAAAKAGIRAGDEIASVNGVALRDAPLAKSSAKAAVEAALLLRKATETSAPVALRLRRLGQVVTVSLKAEQGCASRIELVPGSKLNAKADGEVVQLTTAVLSEAKNDDELAFIIAHEMAHNALGHPQMLKAQGRTTARILATEIEADQFSLKLMHKAGYDPAAAARFWTRFGKKTGLGIFSDGTHQRAAARVQALEAGAKALTQ
jgi:beta-barrel assembly-enhancing protease